MVYRVVGANFDQMHLNTNLEWALDHPDTEITALCDEVPETSTGSLEQAASDCGIQDDDQYDDLERCLEETDPDIVLGGPMNADHPRFVERVLAYDTHVAIEKPFAMSLADADRMLDAEKTSGGRLAVNWPVMWSPVHNQVKQLVDNGTIGEITEVHYYGGNAGAPPDGSWFYDTESGGGSLLDYLGYGATFATWFRSGELPQAVSTQTHNPEGASADFQSVSICRYDSGLSTFQTSLQMLTHPWEHDSTPAKGFDIVGTKGTITTRQHDAPIYVQTRDDPDGYELKPDELEPPRKNLVQYLVHCLDNDERFEGPVDPEFCREAQRILETAQRSSSNEGSELSLVDSQS